MTHPFRFLALAGALAAASFVTPAGAASIADCGQINVDATETCTAEVKGGCTAQCTPIHFEAACAGKLEAECETSCSKLPDVSCTGSCQADCNTQCTVTPAQFSCEGSCTAKCEGTCSAKCSGTASARTTDGGASADAKGECMASCKSTCGGECHGSCTGTPATADCQGKCAASCKGSCTADLNMDCQTTCQSKSYVSCQAELEGGCKTQCTQPEGALFCNGQYVDHGGNAQSCIDALNAYLKAKVDVSATGSCSGNTCQGQASISTKCSVTTPAQSTDTTGAGAALGALVGLGAAARRRRR
jgi:MYXO-CTERM domain-containing protein